MSGLISEPEEAQVVRNQYEKKAKQLTEFLELEKRRAKILFWLFLVFLVVAIFRLIFPLTAEAQFIDPYQPRPVAQFTEGQEEHAILHWHHDLDILKGEWIPEYTHWRTELNMCAMFLGYGETYWPENPTMRSYDVDRNQIIIDYLTPTKYYPSIIYSANVHIAFGHMTEDQFAAETFLVYVNNCHCRQSLGIDVCNADYLRRRPYRFVKHVINKIN